MKKKSLQQITEFVDKKAKEQLSESPKRDEIIRAKAALKKYSSKPTKEFTFTVGEINAYLG
ncbi:MAG: hypothetical protein SWO11_07390 [Thermodesulfobacteriota bacterium]|nr:hypothetical protein [Thermodesulfobacteriota bacterium]